VANEDDIRHGRHYIFSLHVHLDFVTKYWRGVFTKEIVDDLRVIFADVCRDFEAELTEFDGEDDHVCLLLNYPPKVPLSALVNSLKGVSSHLVRKKNYPGIRRKLWGGALCPPFCFAGSCGGAPIEIVRQYIEQQRTPHERPRRTPTASALSFPAVNGEVCRATDQVSLRCPDRNPMCLSGN
jgi:putative transposase